MNRLDIKAIALAVGLACSASALAGVITPDDYKAGKARIGAEDKAAQAACASFAGNARDICKAEARGKAAIARAELEVSHKPSAQTHFQARVARSNADYAVAKERCDDRAGAAKRACVKQAKMARTAATADAKAKMATADGQMASEKSADARIDAYNQAATVRSDTATDSRSDK